MRLTITLLGCFLITTLFARSYDRFFTQEALRLDLYQVGTHDEELITVSGIYKYDQWSGSLNNLLDTLNLGMYLFRVIDPQTNQVIFSRGFSSLFNEWQTTDEALDGKYTTIPLTLVMPFPKNPVQIEILRRDERNYFTRLIFSDIIDPQSPEVRHEKRATGVQYTALIENGDPHLQVDLAVVGDGYTLQEVQDFYADARRLVDTLFTISPFKENKNRFNVYAVLRPSAESGTDDPRKNIFKNTSVSTSFNTFGIQRYMMTEDVHTLHDIASAVPYDALMILVNTEQYGGGGIFNFYAISAADNEWSSYVFVHEFGHSFGGLGDEYYSSSVAYNEFYPEGVEPWEPNITALLNPPQVKWQAFVTPGTPIPTPWNKELFDRKNEEFQKKIEQLTRQKASQEKIDRVRQEAEKWRKEFFAKHPYRNAVGAFEGAGYSSEGLYRPALQCIMFVKGLPGFDPVCKHALEQVIHFYSE